MKKVLVIRLGAIGDMIIITPLLRLLKQDGYYVTLYTKKSGAHILKHNPNIDKVLLHDDDIKLDELEALYIKISRGYDKVVNLSMSIEGTLVKTEGRSDFNWDQVKRHAACNVNYYDRTNDLGGYIETGLNGELFFSPLEHSQARKFRRKYAGRFMVIWVLSGSSYHKAYPYAEYVAKALCKYPEIMICTVGDAMAELLEWDLLNTKRYANRWEIRKSMIMTKYADLVVGPDTGMLHAAGCYDTPKILLLSSATDENISKHWKNKHVLTANVECYPCHRLITTLQACPLEPGLGTPVCMSQLHSKSVFNAIESEYLKWRNHKWGRSTQEKEFFTPRMKDTTTRQQKELSITL
jgi:ADP-heptose:LPS heptosyltransferase